MSKGFNLGGIFLSFLLILLLFSSNCFAEDIGNWWLEGIKAVAEKDFARIEVLPETAPGNGSYMQIFDLNYKKDVGVSNARAVYIFPEKVTGTIERWVKPVLGVRQQQRDFNMLFYDWNYVDTGDPDNPYFVTIYYTHDVNGLVIEWEQDTKDSNKTGDFRTFYWDENVVVSGNTWLDVGNKFHALGEVDYNGESVWYYYSDEFSLTVGQKVRWRINYFVTAPSGKWTLAFIKGDPDCLLDNSCLASWIIDPAWRTGNYDTFEDAQHSSNPAWVHSGTGGTEMVNQQSAKNGTYGLEFDGLDSSYLEFKTTISVATLDTWMWIRVSDVSGDYILWQYQEAGTGSICGMTISSNNFKYRDDSGYQNMATSPSTNTWYIFRMDYNASDMVNFYLYDDSFTLLESITDKTANATGDVGFSAFFIQNSDANIRADDIGYGDSNPPVPPTSFTILRDFNNSTNYLRGGSQANADFNVSDPNNNAEDILVDFNLVSTPLVGTGTVVYQDLNLSTAFTADTNDLSGSFDVNFSYTFTVPSLDANYYACMMFKNIKDDLNYGGCSASSIMIDSTKPFTYWDANHATWQKDTNIHLTCDDGSGSACASTMYRLDTDLTDAITYGTWQSYDNNIYLDQDGNWTIDFNSTDRAGNVGDTNTFHLLIDKLKPSTSWNGEHNIWKPNDVNILLTCVDNNGSGCSSTRYRVDVNSTDDINYGAWQTYDTNVFFDRDGNWAIDFNSTDAVKNVGDINTFYVLVNKQFSTDENLASGFVDTALAIGDLDKDGDLDIVLTGKHATTLTNFTLVYVNDGSSNFTLDQNLYGIVDGSILLGDIDNDSDLDLITIGGGVSLIHFNDGSANFSNDQNLLGLDDSGAVLGDLDNDGDLDLVLSGTDGSIRHFETYSNDGSGNFTIDQNFIGLDESSIVLGDFDNDEDLDIASTGQSTLGKFAGIHFNDGTGSFSNDLNFTGDTNHGSIVAGDLDNDADLDIVLGFSVLINDGTGSFSNDVNLLSGIGSSALALGDVDNDGDLDLLKTGTLIGGSTFYTLLYYNSGDANFSNDFNFYGSTGSIAFADFDNDEDLDLALTDITLGAASTVTILLNDESVYNPNTAPTAPTAGFSSSYSSGVLSISWGDGSDTETSADGLYYNLKIGTNVDGNNSVSPFFASSYSGSGEKGGQNGLLGNMMQRQDINLTIPSARFYWAIQTIDSSFEISPWSATQTSYAPTDYNILADFNTSTNYLAGGSQANVDFQVFDADNNAEDFLVDFNLVSTPLVGTGTVIFKDLNLSVDFNSDTNNLSATYDANFSYLWTVASLDTNYYGCIMFKNIRDDSNFGSCTSLSIMLDSTDPFTYYDGNHSIWQSTDANIHLTCDDGSGSACASTRYRLDTNYLSGIAYGAWQDYDLNILIDQDGNWVIDFNSTDRAGNVGDTNTFHLLVDKRGPSLDNNRLSSISVLVDTEVTIYIDVSDYIDLNTISVEARVNDPGGNLTTVSMSFSDGNTYYCLFDDTSLGGTYEIDLFTAKDTTVPNTTNLTSPNLKFEVYSGSPPGPTPGPSPPPVIDGEVVIDADVNYLARPGAPGSLISTVKIVADFNALIFNPKAIDMFVWYDPFEQNEKMYIHLAEGSVAIVNCSFSEEFEHSDKFSCEIVDGTQVKIYMIYDDPFIFADLVETKLIVESAGGRIGYLDIRDRVINVAAFYPIGEFFAELVPPVLANPYIFGLDDGDVVGIRYWFLGISSALIIIVSAALLKWKFG